MWCDLADDRWSRLEEEGQQELIERQVLLPAYHSQTARIFQGWVGVGWGQRYQLILPLDRQTLPSPSAITVLLSPLLQASVVAMVLVVVRGPGLDTITELLRSD